MQLLMYQNKDNIELASYLDVNTNNLLKLINWEHQYGYHSNHADQKFNVNFDLDEQDIMPK